MNPNLWVVSGNILHCYLDVHMFLLKTTTTVAVGLNDEHNTGCNDEMHLLMQVK
jgi:hypothetical protein